MCENIVAEKGCEQNELISVIIPTYNRVELLGRSVQSVLSQTYTNLELLIIDDCSKDNTGEFVKGLSDKRIRYHRNEHNMGLAGAKNIGVSLAKGEFVAFQDDDDEWLPDKLMHLMEVWKKESDKETGLIYHEMQEQGNSTFIPSRDIPLEWKYKEIFHHMLLYPMIGATASLIRKSCLNELGGFNENLKSIEDYEFYLRVAKKYRVLFVGEPLMIIYDTPGSVNKRFKSKIDTELYILDTMYDSLCQYDILQKKVNLIRQQAENYECDDYFYEQVLSLCDRLQKVDGIGPEKNEECNGEEKDAFYNYEKGRRIRECISNAAGTVSHNGGGDRAEYYQNAAGQIQRVINGLSKLQDNLKNNSAMLSKNRTAVVEALADIIKNLGDYTDLAFHPVPKKQKMDELLEKLIRGQSSNGIIINVLDDTIKEAWELFSQIGKAKCLCTVCGKEVRILPASPYKQVLREHYGYKGEEVDFLFEGEEDRCPVCGAPENIRFLLGFLEDIQPEGSEQLKICCMEAAGKSADGIKEWVRKYASVKEYLEYVLPKDIEEKYGNESGTDIEQREEKVDVLICADVFERAENDSEIPERIKSLLKENGVCIVMMLALLRDTCAGISEEMSADAAEEGNADVSGDEKTEIKRIKKFGLEGVRRVYTERDIKEKFEEAGFSVEILDENWFGRDYYEQCGFGKKAKMFMLTKEV